MSTKTGGFISSTSRKISEGVKQYFANLTPEERETLIQKSREGRRKKKK